MRKEFLIAVLILLLLTGAVTAETRQTQDSDADQRREAGDRLSTLLALEKEGYVAPTHLAWAHIALGQTDQAVSPRRINEIVRRKRAISANTALRLSRYFGMSERFWVNLQARYQIEVEKDRLGEQLDQEVEPLSRPA